MSHRALGPMFHGTSAEWAKKIATQGQRSNMSPTGRVGPGFYVTPNMEEARAYARGKGWEHAVVEGVVPEPRVYDMSLQDRKAVDEIWNRPANSDWQKDLLRFSAGVRRQGYNLIRLPNPEENEQDWDYHAVIRPKTFVPTRIHYPSGVVNLR